MQMYIYSSALAGIMARVAEIESRNPDPVINICLDTIAKRKQALVFVNNKRSAEKCAEDMAKTQNVGSPELEQLSDKVLNALSRPTVQCKRLAACVKRGVAFHHAGLTQKQKDIVEEAFKTNRIRIICCTPTLAAGVDLPAFRSIIRDLKRFGQRGLSNIPVLEFEQMAGRAGRPKFDSFGEAICIAKTEIERNDIRDFYIYGSVEDIYSKLAVEPVLRTYLLSLIASGFVSTKKSIMKFFESTFWAHQYKDMLMLERIIDKMLRLLMDFEFITRSGAAHDDFVSASDLGRDETYRASALGKRVAQLYLDPLTANQLIECLRRASSRGLDDFALIHMICFTLEMRPLLTLRTKEWEDIQDSLAKHEDMLLTEVPSIYDSDAEEFLNSIKTALFLADWCDEMDEEALLEKYNIRPGEIRVKLERSDWLLYATIELARLLEYRPMLSEIIRVRTRLKYGVKEELLPLLKVKGIGRVRARKLFSNRIKDVGDLKRSSFDSLAQILGRETAARTKEQLGQDVPVIPKTKRTGQLSLEKF